MGSSDDPIGIITKFYPKDWEQPSLTIFKVLVVTSHLHHVQSDHFHQVQSDYKVLPQALGTTSTPFSKCWLLLVKKSC